MIFKTETLQNIENLIFITNTSKDWQKEWRILVDLSGDHFTDIDEAIKHVRKFGAWGCGLATFKQAQMGNAEWDNL